MSRLLAVAWIACFAAMPISAGGREVIRTDWNGFQQQVRSLSLEGRKAYVLLASGEVVKTRIHSAADSALVVSASRATKQWASGKKEAAIPKEQIRSVRFLGHMGHRGVIVGLATFGATLAIGSAVAASQDAFQITEGPAIIAVPAGLAAGSIGAGVGGYYIGRATSRQMPEFVIRQ